MSTAQAAKSKLLKCNECGVSGADERLFSRNHVLCSTCAAVRYKLEHESFDLCRASNTTGASYRRKVGRGLIDNQPITEYVPASLNNAFFHATVHTKDQVPKLFTPPGSIYDLRHPKKRVRRNH